MINKGQAAWFGLAWLPVVCENKHFTVYIYIKGNLCLHVLFLPY